MSVTGSSYLFLFILSNLGSFISIEEKYNYQMEFNSSSFTVWGKGVVLCWTTRWQNKTRVPAERCLMRTCFADGLRMITVIFSVLRHYPIGVLFDLHASNTALPWNISVHFKVCRLLHSLSMCWLICHSHNVLCLVELPRTRLASLPDELCDRSTFHVVH